MNYLIDTNIISEVHKGKRCNILDMRIADRELRMHDSIDHNGAAHCGGIKLTYGPARPFGIICCDRGEYREVVGVVAEVY